MKTNTLDFDAQALRERILDLAMRGKLVPQDPNDEPASVLLEKIKAEKAELVKEKKIKKTKALPAITDDEKPFDIPDSWEWVRLGDIITTINGDRGKNYPGKKYWQSTGIPFLNAACLTADKYIDKAQFNYISKERFELLRSGFIKKEDILYCIRGSLGKVGIVNINNGAIASSLIIIRKLLANQNMNFLYYVFCSSVNTMFIDEHRNGTAQPNIPGKDLLKMRIPFPPLSEQSRIAAKIAQLFALLRKVELSTQQYAELQTLLKSKVLDLAMRGKLVKQDPNDEPASVLLEKIKAEKAELVKEKKIKKSKPLPPITDEEKPFDIPDSWEWVRLGNVAKKITDGTHNPPPNSHSGKQLISAINIKNGKIDFKLSNRFVTDSQFEKEDKRTHIRKGDVLLTIVGSLGNAAIVENDKLFTAQRSVAIISSDLLSKYLYYSLTSKMFQEQIFNNAKGTTQRGIYLKKLSGLILPLPPINEQFRIVNKINELYWLI